MQAPSWQPLRPISNSSFQSRPNEKTSEGDSWRPTCARHRSMRSALDTQARLQRQLRLRAGMRLLRAQLGQNGCRRRRGSPITLSVQKGASPSARQTATASMTTSEAGVAAAAAAMPPPARPAAAQRRSRPLPVGLAGAGGHLWVRAAEPRSGGAARKRGRLRQTPRTSPLPPSFRTAARLATAPARSVAKRQRTAPSPGAIMAGSGSAGPVGARGLIRGRSIDACGQETRIN
mmetsp:Transcript_17307/g.52119  ORF Transcript_17307/g.52119 Transcript_17307/m.52119 type:complete len:233 (+) Transcript_17307:971-1669(+)